MLIFEESLESLECGTVEWNSEWEHLLGSSKSIISSFSSPLSSKSMQVGLGLITTTLLTASIFPLILLLINNHDNYV